MNYISSPEFVNLQPLDINPLMSKCEIKVMYVGENRNRSIITKDVAFDMAKTLRGCPIVGYYREDISDFGTHENCIEFTEDGKIKFTTKTKPYGFVAPDSKVWFQKMKNKHGEEKEYLMTEGYLWTSQFPECQSVVDNGKGQSMELNEDTLQGVWSHDKYSGVDFFIINDATFSKLCILGDDVEPCFEDASIEAPKNYTFKQTLFSMMEDLKQVLGGNQMDEKLENVENYVSNPKKKKEEAKVEEGRAAASEEKAKKEEQKASDQKEEAKKDNKMADSEEDKKKKKNFTNEDNEEDKKAYELLKSEINSLKEQYSLLENEVKNLREYKQTNENIKKDKMIQEDFYMLSEEDKKDVIQNKDKYTLEEIESKLSVIAVRNKVNFDKGTEEKKPETNFTLNVESNPVPAFIEALRNTKQRNN